MNILDNLKEQGVSESLIEDIEYFRKEYDVKDELKGGLCPQCGKKKAECICQPAEPTEAPVDTRLAILKSLLN